MLQYFGTEVMRGQMYDGIWVDSCIGRYKGQNTVIADTRFPNEVKQIREHGGKIILVKRGPDPDWFVDYVEGNIEPKGIHSSEYAWAKEVICTLAEEYIYTVVKGFENKIKEKKRKYNRIK